MDTTTQTSTEPAAELVYLAGTTATNGLTLGSELAVPEGYAAVVVMNSQPYDAVGPGHYTIDASTFPRLAQKLQLGPGGHPTKRVDITVFLMNVTNAVMSWRARPLVTKDARNGLTYCDLMGRCSVRVVDPARFHGSLQAGWAKVVKRMGAKRKAQLAGASIGKQAEIYIGAIISAVAANAIAGIPAEQFATASGHINQSLGSMVAGALNDIGLQCTGFEVSNQPEARRAPCSSCGSTTAPTAYGQYRRTISLLYIRFGAKREGNFCVPCAAKVWGSYCGVMLVCGWWGLIGLILTPVYIGTNTYYFFRTAFGQKAPAGAPAIAAAGGASWPPAPADEWGQEVQDR